jgi:3-deoxy-D-manno-octulosonic-acid transferase
MRILYTASVYLYLFVIRITSLFNPKARLWLSGRHGLFSKLKEALEQEEHLLWFHCASLGEFEQARPLIETLKKRDPSCRILLTFFSPSGYEIRKDYDKADFVFYLPIDTPQNARLFLDIVRPNAVYIIKYEFWYNLLSEIRKRKIPAFLVSGIFREDQHFFKWYGTWFLNQLRCFTKFYLQDEMSITLLKRVGFQNCVLAGDTRFDRVAAIAAEARELPLVKAFCENKKLLIVGSSWEKDEALTAGLALAEQGYKLLIAPHEMGTAELSATIACLGQERKVLCYSNANLSNAAAADVLIIDNIGMLSSLYKYGSLAYIGGGFGDGIHNILEAAVWGLPVIFGPNYQKFSEAHELIELGGAFCIHNQEELKKIVSDLTGDTQRMKIAAEVSAAYVKRKGGATEKILSDTGSVRKLD